MRLPKVFLLIPLLLGATLPEWVLPPPPVVEVFKSVYAVYPVLYDPIKSPTLKEGHSLVSPYAGTGFLVEGYLITAAHVILPISGDKRAVSKNGDLYIEGRRPFIKDRLDEASDVAAFPTVGYNLGKALYLQVKPPEKQELVWWICRGGFLANEWSMGRYLDEIPPHKEYKYPTYFINPIVGGIHSGCSGSPIFNAQGEVIGLVSATNDAGSILNAIVIRAAEIQALLK